MASVSKSYKPLFLGGVEGSGGLAVREGKGQEAGKLLITLQNRKCVHFNEAEKSAETTFFGSSFLDMSVPICYDKNSDQFVTVVNKNNLLLWNGEEKHLEKIQPKCRLHKPVMDVVVMEGNPFLVFQDGDVQSVEFILNRQIAEETISSEDMSDKKVKCRLVNHRNCLHAILISENVVEICLLTMDPMTREYQQCRVRTIELKGCLDCEVVGNHVVWTTTKNEGIQISPLFEDTPAIQISTPKVLSNLAALDSKHFCFFTSAKEGEDGGLLQVYNTNYGIQVASSSVKVTCPRATKAEEWPGVVCHNRKCYFKHGNRVAVIDFESLPESLSELIGMNSNAKSSEVETVSLKTPGGISSFKWKETNETTDINCSAFLLAQKDGLKAEALEALLAEGTKLPESLVVPLLESLLKKGKKAGEDKTLITKVLMLPITEETMVQHMREVTSSTASRLFQVVLELFLDLNNDDSDGGEKKFSQLLLWMSIILDAHYGNFAVSKDEETKNAIIQCAELIGELDGSINMLGSLMAQVKVIQARVAMKKHNLSGQKYAIEVIQF